ncbi:hypothetical protein [Nocardioides halotolerans]|uniref:hypothetical protein n=1 Tax=Nocardioides halotolerans TaxID=433660 RepID=UPI0004172C2F|nr:hypothetical protein [Nocardioides halotolerans]
MSASTMLATAVLFVWLGMVLAISFMETPLKFRAPGVTVQLGLGIGRLVFRALNAAELVLASVLVIALVVATPPARVVTGAAVAVVVLAAQVALVRPVLSRRSDRVLAGESPPRSRAHYWYVGLELVKVVALPVTGVMLMHL